MNIEYCTHKYDNMTQAILLRFPADLGNSDDHPPISSSSFGRNLLSQ